MNAAAAPTQACCVAVAVSGGRDSTALWHAAARAAKDGDLRVVGLHVHHGLLPEADAWVARLRAQARRWAAKGLPVSLVWRRLQGSPAAGESLEAWARRERYRTLTEMAREQGAGLVLLAHHRRDQAETFLLQALRGAGPAGLSAMPRLAQRGGISWARPWLDEPRERIDAYVQRHRLSWIEDPSNTDRRRARNALRQGVWPALMREQPHAEACLAASARRAHEAAACLAELALLDRQRVCSTDGALDIAAWLALSPARRSNLLRSWLAASAPNGVPESLIVRLADELPQASTGAWPLHDDWLRAHGGRLQVVAAADAASPPSPEALQLDLSRCGRHELPAWGGAFEVRAAGQGGVSAALLRQAWLRPRRGGERFQSAPGGVPRALKKQYQAAHVPPWLRGGPLVWAGELLLYVPGLGMDARRLAPSAAGPLRRLRWVPDDPGKP